MRQLPAAIGYEQLPFESSHVSSVQLGVSEQVLAVAHTPVALHRPQPASVPSSQFVVMGRLVHAVGLSAESQYWHSPFVAPFGWHAPPIMQLPVEGG